MWLMRAPNTRPIGIFDSGVGGLTVARSVRKELPLEEIVYFGDTARVPYGNKSKEKHESILDQPHVNAGNTKKEADNRYHHPWAESVDQPPDKWKAQTAQDGCRCIQ